MAFHPTTGELYQGENSHDKRDEQHLSRLGPADELNIIREGADYGWPYCVEYKNETPPYQGGNWNCASYEQPHLLLPPHGAPLAMLFYTGDKLPVWYHGRLIMPLHSAEPFAHRIISFEMDAQRRPIGRPLNLVWNWESAEPGRAFNGFPFGITQASDGSLFLTEDKNQTVLRLSVDTGPGVESAPPAPWEADDEWMGPRGL
jgi:glucose/arabinose dehydrogenase